MKYKYKQYGNELRFDYCPICKKSKVSNPCFSINIENGKYMCHATGKSGIIKNLENFDLNLEDIKVLKKESVDFNKIMEVVATQHLSSSWLDYLERRGISQKGLKRLVRLGKFNSMLIPITNGKDVVGIKYRTLDKKMSCEKGSSSNYLINWQNVKDKSYLIIVEGEIDLLSIIEAGYDNVVSLPFGAKNTKCIDIQKSWINKFQKIIIATDNDIPGKKCRDEIVEKLRKYEDKIYFVNYGEYKDFNEVLMAEGTEKVQKIIKKSEKYTFEFSPFQKKSDGYYIMQKDSYTKLTDFTIDIDGYSKAYIKGVVTNDGREMEFEAKKTELLTKQGILEHLGYYMGSSQSIAKFWSWIISNSKESFLLEIPHYGIIDNAYYDENSKVICGKQDLKIQNLEEIEILTKDEKEWLNENLIYLRSDPNQSLLGICWALGRLHNGDSYPLLEVAGTTSIGKTEYVEFISRILFGTKENIKSFSLLSNHQIRSISSCSNITPWAIDEVKITGKKAMEKAAELYSTIRAVYDNKTINQGNTGTKLTEFKLCTPLIISGETELNDVSIKNRMIVLKLNKGNKSSDEIFFKFKNSNLLEKLGRAALDKRLQDGKIDVNLETIKGLLQDVKDERQLYNGKCILGGLKALNGIIKLDDEIRENFIEFLNTRLKNEYDVIANFKELLELVVESGVSYDYFYRNYPDEHIARFNLLYKAIKEEHEKTNSTLELLDMKTLRKQLLESGFIIKNSISTRAFGSKVVKATVFKDI